MLEPLPDRRGPGVAELIVIEAVQPPDADTESAHCKERAPRLRDGSGARAHCRRFRLGQCSSPFPIAVAPASPIALRPKLYSRRMCKGQTAGQEEEAENDHPLPEANSSGERRNAWGAHSRSSSSGMCGSAPRANSTTHSSPRSFLPRSRYRIFQARGASLSRASTRYSCEI